MALVSICIPAYKDARGVKRLLDSICSSDYADVEVIITDDTPDDSVADAVRDCLSDIQTEADDAFTGQLRCASVDANPDVHYRHNAPGLGPAGNWNRSLDLAQGEYIKIMHQDDWFTFPDSLSRFVRMLDSNPDAVLAYCGSRQVTIKPDDPEDLSDYFDRCIKDENRALIEKDYRGLYIGQYIGAPSAVIYRRSDLRFDPNLKWLIDADFYMGLLKDGGRMVCSKDPLVSIGVSDTQLTNDCIASGEVNIREYKYVFNKFGLGEKQEYRDRLSDICVRYKGKYEDISDCGITKEEYKPVLKAYRRELCDFYRHLIIRKLFPGKHFHE
ncbi:MAG: glycosyltransferase family 2 protein [Lachnospiraceae bacterium]|nr:glycosyltransferase family 2 protein [Lachnospiraceae bacterium]